MDVSELLKDPRARAKDAEALAILTACAHPATQILDQAKRNYGTVLRVSDMGMLIDPAAEQMYKSGKRDATRLLFDAYASIVFSEILDAEGFIAALHPIRAQVETTLPVIDAHEAELCRLEWVKHAWDRGTPSTLQRAWRRFLALWKPLTTASDRALADVPAPTGAGGVTPSLVESAPSVHQMVGPIENSTTPTTAIGHDAKNEMDPEIGVGARMQPSRLGVPLVLSLKTEVRDWNEVEIRFLSDLRVQVGIGTCSETRNYSELGFEDGRSKGPNRAWRMLRLLAEANGTIPRALDGQDWTAVEKRMQELRKSFAHHFQMSEDPLPFVEGIGYQARFKISCAPSYNS
jgi:hypothetical protein